MAGRRMGDQVAASVVEVDDAIQGPVVGVAADPEDPRKMKVSILGQTVVIEDGFSVFDGTSFAGIGMGDDVEVHGFRDADGVITATRVQDPPTNPGVVELHGFVENLAGAGFEITGVDVDATGATLDPAGLVLANGDFVEVMGTYDGSTVDATVVELELLEDDLPSVEVEGIVANFAGLADFEIDGQPVVAQGLPVRFDPFNTGGAFVEDGARIEVEGRIENGFLLATQVILRGGQVRIAAEIVDVDPGDGVVDAIDEEARSLTLLGRVETVNMEDRLVAGAEFVVDASTRFDGTCSSFDDLDAGQFATARGVRTSGSQVRATEIACAATPGDVQLRGLVQSFDGTQGNVTVLSARFHVDAGTDFVGFPAGVVDGSPITFFQFLSSSALVLIEVTDFDDGDAAAIDPAADVIELETD
jgi:hypothetical protein